MDNRYLSLPLAVALGLASPCALALGLGQLQVKSGLNQPLVAEIPIISATASELDQLDVRLASPDAFARVGLERPGELTANLQFSVGKNARGQPVILVTTPTRFSEPLLSFLIEAEWGKGRVTREYTALIDPPYIAAAVIQPMLAPPVPMAVAPVPQPILPPVAMPEPEPAQTQPAPEPPPAEVVEAAEPVPALPAYQEPTPVAVAPPPAPAPTPPPPPPPRPVATAPPPPPPAPEPAPVAAPQPPDRYGPVASGQTLWSIANAVRPDSAVSVNQMMVALLRANPDAFAQDNVNLLKRGSVLRVPGQEEVGRLSDAEAAALVGQQAAAWRTPRQAVPQPAESASVPAIASEAPAARAEAPAQTTPAAPKSAATPRVASARPARPASRLEIVPPSGNAAARGAQSGAAAGAGGSELRAELAQAREDLAARTSEVTELKTRVSELEQQDADRQRLIDMQNSQMKDLQDRLAQMEKGPAEAPAEAATAIAASPSTTAPAAASPEPVARPWYLNPLMMGGVLLLLLGGLVLALRRSKAVPGNGDASAPRLSDDEALRASMAKTREAGSPIPSAPAKPVAVVVPVTPAPVPGTAAAPVAPGGSAAAGDREVAAFREAVRARPQDIEAHVSLLRLLHMRGNFAEFEAAAQEMRAHVPNTLDPRWREVVIMGASLMPANSQLGQSGWNTPKFEDPGAPPKVSSGVASPSPSPSPSFLAGVKDAPSSAAAPVGVFDAPPDEASVARPSAVGSDDLDLDEFEASLADGGAGLDIHRNEAQVMDEDEASATRIELAKAYLDIGDLDGARSMLEEVVSEGGPAAQAEAGRILKEIG